MDSKFTLLLKEWLEAPEGERDYTVGALYLLKLSGNQIAYRTHIARLDRCRGIIESQLQKYYNFRVAELTREQVQQMSEQVDAIAEKHALTSDTSDDEKRTGKRADHDSLPDNVKAKFVENLSILQRMRELHLRLRNLSLDNATCPDSERYPFLKELISLDKKLHANWEAYDKYVAPDPTATPSRSKRSAGSKTKNK